MNITLSYPDQSEQSVEFDELLQHSKYTLLYFYPKDNTPGCTREAANFSNLYDEFLKLGVQIVGVSTDSHKSHCSFATKLRLRFPLISDQNLILHQDSRFDTRQEKKMFGKSYMGSSRDSFLLDQSGTVIHSRRKVKPLTHAHQVLEYIKSL